MSFFGKSDVQGILYLALALFLATGLVSYHPLDPSLNSLGQETVHNYCGYIGAFVSDLLYQGFGLGSYLLVFEFLKKSFLSFSGKKMALLQSGVIGGVFLLTTCALFTWFLPETRWFQENITAGGIFGQMIVSGLISITHKAGALIILVTSLVCCMVMSSHRPLRYHLKNIHKGLSVLYSYSKQYSISLWHALCFLKKKSIHIELPPISFNQTSPSIEIEEDINTNEVTSDEMLSTPIYDGHWEKPSTSLLPSPKKSSARISDQEIKQQTEKLVDKLAQFSITGEMVGIKSGPAVTLFEFRPADSVKVGKITQLADDLSMALSAESLRIIAPIPGRDVVGIEASNSSREIVHFKDVIGDEVFQNRNWDLPLAMGRFVDGSIAIQELCQMPHLMVAGSTGSGKSVFVTSILSGFLMHHSPETLRLILVDPKQVDLHAFDDIPHLLFPPIVQTEKALETLNWTIGEMNKRYRSLNQFHVRGMKGFNHAVSQLSEEEKTYHESQNTTDTLEQDYYFKPLPYICVVVEEFGDLMTGPKKIQVEQAVVKLAQMARACGIHLILAMQSPRKDVITGLIKTNIPGRISFKVSSKIDSRVILDESGAERLLAKGDMLFLAPGSAKMKRCHGAFISEDDIHSIVEFWKKQGSPQYQVMEQAQTADSNFHTRFGELDEDMEKYNQIKGYISSLKTVSTSSLQRKFRLGYPRAARMMEMFEEEGLVGPAQGSKPREVIKT